MNAITLFTALKNHYIITGSEREWGRLYSALLEIPNPPYTTFVQLGYFRRLQGTVQRFQEIPDAFKTYRNPTKLFISHRWETTDHPDPNRKTLEKLLSLTRNFDDKAAIWWDYCSLPQRCSDGQDDRSVELKEYFKFQLSLIPLVILDSQCMFLWSEEGLNSGWCCVELLITQALLNHLNQLIYKRRQGFLHPPLFLNQVENRMQVESDLYRFDHQIRQKVFCTEVASARHQQIITWLNRQMKCTLSMPYSQMMAQVTPELVSKMILEHELTFTNGADAEVVASILIKIYQRLSLEAVNDISWNGKIDFFTIWHYVKGCIGNCIVPTISYRF